MAEALASDHRRYVSRAVEGLLLGGWKIKSIPGSRRLAQNRQRIRLECSGTSLDLRLHLYSIGMTGRARDDERRIEITSTFMGSLRPLEGVGDVVLGYDRASRIFVGFDPRRLETGGETHNATSFFDRRGLALARGGPLITRPRHSQLFGTEHHAFFEPVRLAEYLFNREDIHAGLYTGGGMFADVPRRSGRRRLAGAAGDRDDDVLVLKRNLVRPKAQRARRADVTRSEQGSAQSRKTTPEALKAILKRKEENGERGERQVVDRERRRLQRAKQIDLANRVRWVAREDVSLGYDIHSYETDGRDKLIEVKSTEGGSRRFEMSANEWRAAERHGERYYIARVTHVRDEKRSQVVELQNPAALLESGEITRQPAAWRVTH